ncbi:NHL repeat-containing protein [Flavivirga algicola]|uniref:6-bladed beta-propeller n=1 Tax=Flavivirga algicola TaxID=2729136 RepID=A0ABX1S2Y0_9FLAO|nr:6-bladed beta-propeller [Flavivirga algicola]NMH89268.1 6-bladed beta-propeller [Flavivirga algicola]
MAHSRRDFIKKTALASASLSLPTYGFTILKKPELHDEIIGHGHFKYRVHKAWGNLNPANTPVKNCHEMVMDSKGRLIMVTDEVRNNIIVYDKSGKLLTSWTYNMKSGHGLTLFKEGEEDMLFVLDNSGRIIKTTITGKIIMELPKPHDIGVYTKKMRYRPTETTVAPNGDIYVSDGYGSDWILQYNKDGEFIRKFGGKGHKDEQLNNAHGVAIDDRDPNNVTLLCTSRVQNSFKRYTLDGEYISTIFLPGAYVCRPVIDGENIYSGVCWSRMKYLERVPNSGFVTILDKNDEVVSNPGGTKPKYKGGKLQLMLQNTSLFNHCHDVCVDEDKNLYICQWNANRSYPIKLERV